MLLELYITMLVLNFIVFGIAFFRKNEWLWSISLVLSSMLIFSSFNIVENVAVVSNQTTTPPATVNYEYTILTHSNTDKGLFAISLGMFLLSLALFLNDLFMNMKDHKLGQRRF